MACSVFCLVSRHRVQCVLVSVSEKVLKAWVVNDLCPAWDLRSVFWKVSNLRFCSKQSPGQRVMFKPFIRCNQRHPNKFQKKKKKLIRERGP